MLGYWGNLGKLELNTTIHVQGPMKINPKSSALCFTSSETLLQCQGPPWVEPYLFHRYPGIRAIWGNCSKYPKSHVGTHTWKVIQTLQILIPHQMRPYSSGKGLCRVSYTCFPGTQVLGQFGEIGLECPKLCAGTYEK